jgi:flagellar biosynthesis protein FlhG
MDNQVININNKDIHSFQSSILGYTITITSRKGGTGNTVITWNLGACFAELSYNVLIVDTNRDVGGISSYFPGFDEWLISDLRKNREELNNMFKVSSSRRIKVLKASYQDFVEPENKPLIAEIFNQFDVRLVDVDTTSMIPSEIIGGPLVGQIVIVTNSEPAGLTEAYGLFKNLLLNCPSQKQSINLIVNQANSQKEGDDVSNTLNTVTMKYLGREFKCLNHIEKTWEIKQSIRLQKAVIECFPESESSSQFRILASELIGRGK